MSTDQDPDASLRCAPVARALGYVPSGTAASATLFLLVEAPLPWPNDVADHPVLAPLAPLLRQHPQARLQALVPNGEAPEGHVRIILYRQPRGPLARYVRHERVVPVGRLVYEAAVLLGGATAGNLDYHDPLPDVTDVLVCTHGSRDVCCGRDGTRVHLDLLARNLPGVRVWRTSHTGGHRFAPTAITLPDGRAWAFVDGGLLADVVTRTAPSTVAAAHDRGCAGLPDPFAQAAEGAVLAAEGWGWLDRPRSVTVTPSEGNGDGAGDGTVRVTVVGHPDGNGRRDPVTYRADVAVRRVVPVPDCGRPIEDATKTARELEVVTLERLD